MLAENLAIATGMVVATCAIHAAGIEGLQRMQNSKLGRRWREGPVHRRGLHVIFSVFVLMGLHGIEIWAYAALYLWLGQFHDIETALYFSSTTFTTLGYGDVLIGAERRMIAGIEGVSGLILIGWSTAVLVAATTRGAGANGGADRPDARDLP
jgi:voltage-gated potassium channel